MYLRLRSWDRFRIGHTNDENWKFLLDTFGTRRFDLSVEIFNGMHGFVCVVEAGHGHLIGHRRATRPDRRSVACHLPRGWFSHIDRAVRFRVGIEFSTSRNDRDLAPNHGVYRWI